MAEYDDILGMRYPNQDANFLHRHPRMPMTERAKIFSPFAALRGHSDALRKTAQVHEENEKDKLEDADNSSTVF